MILRRLSESIRRQDWFAVLIEFLVVVAGIFAGLQANEWAQERQDRKQERAALERLFLEAQGAYQLLDGYVQQTIRLNQMRRNAIQFVDSDAPVPDNELRLKIGINTLAIFPPIIPVTVAYEELKSSGQMQLIRSAALREQLATFHTELAFQNEQRRGFTDLFGQYKSLYGRHVTWDYNPEATTSDILLSTFDWSSMQSDEGFILEAIGLLRNQLVAEEGLIELHDQAQSLCEAIGHSIGRSCDAS